MNSVSQKPIQISGQQCSIFHSSCHTLRIHSYNGTWEIISMTFDDDIIMEFSLVSRMGYWHIITLVTTISKSYNSRYILQKYITASFWAYPASWAVQIAVTMFDTDGISNPTISGSRRAILEGFLFQGLGNSQIGRYSKLKDPSSQFTLFWEGKELK